MENKYWIEAVKDALIINWKELPTHEEMIRVALLFEKGSEIYHVFNKKEIWVKSKTGI